MERPDLGMVSLPAVYDSERIKKMYRELAVPTETIRTVRRYFEAASHLYGMISLKHLLHIYNSQNPVVSEADFLAIADVIRHEANDFCVLEMDALYEDAPVTEALDREIVSLMVLAFGLDRYYALSDLRAGKAYAVLSKEQFLAYLEPGFYPATPENLNMLAFLRSRRGGPQQPAEAVLSSIQTMIWAGCDLQEALCYLGTGGFQFQHRAERRTFTVLFHAMERHTRTVANRGQTSAALYGQRNLCLAGHRRWADNLLSAARGYIFH